MKRLFLVLALAIIGVANAFAQLEAPVSWSYFAKKTGKGEATVYLKATMEGNWHIYSLDMKGGPTKTSFTFQSSKDFSLVGKMTAPKPITEYNKLLDLNLSYYQNSVVFVQKIKLNKNLTVVKGKVEFMACDKSCLPADEVAFSIPVK